MRVLVLFVSLVIAGAAADSSTDYMNSVLKLAGSYLTSLGMEPVR